MSYEIPLTKAISWNAAKEINALLAGARSQGKSWLGMYLTMVLAKLNPSTQIFVIDYKKSDFSRLAPLLPNGRVASDKEDIFELLENFNQLLQNRIEYFNENFGFGEDAMSVGMPLFYLVYDEFGAFTSELVTKEKQLHDKLIGKIALLGRQYNFGLIAIMQQASVGNSGLSSAVKEQFGLIAHMGSATPSAYRLTFKEDIDFQENRHFERGTGQLWLQGSFSPRTTIPFAAPLLAKEKLYKDFAEAFVNQDTQTALFCSRR